MIDLNNTYKTRDGKIVRIYCTDGDGIYPVHGAIFNKDFWDPYAWTADGLVYLNRHDNDYDLIEAWVLKDKEPILCWDESSIAERCIRFWDKENECTFLYNGLRNGPAFKHYAKVDHIDQWMLDAQLLLKD